MKTVKIKEILEIRDFLILWSGQSLSQMGSSMTSFALIIWAYQKQGTVMSIALLSVFSYLPYILVSIFAGALIDRFSEKKIMLVCDTVASICSLCAFTLMLFGMLHVWQSINEKILGSVSGAVGVGGIIGGLFVSVLRPAKYKVKTIFISSALSFLLCDLLLGIGRTPIIWIFAAFAGNIPIPFLNASENYLLLSKIPNNIQGRVFSIRGSLQFITVPVGYLIGGLLADNVFEPLMTFSEKAKHFLGWIVGVENGSGMALIFIITGISGFTFSLISYCNKDIKTLVIRTY